VIPRTPYIVPYRLVGNTIQVLRVFHTARQWPEAFWADQHITAASLLNDGLSFETGTLVFDDVAAADMRLIRKPAAPSGRPASRLIDERIGLESRSRF